MIAALRGAVYEALKREEENLKVFTRLISESNDEALKNFFRALETDTNEDITMMKHLNLHSMVKFGLAIKFNAPRIVIDDTLAKSIKDVESAKECLKMAIDQLNINIEYYEHIAAHALYPDVKRLCRLIADKELERKSRVKALMDFIE